MAFLVLHDPGHQGEVNPLRLGQHWRNVGIVETQKFGRGAPQRQGPADWGGDIPRLALASPRGTAMLALSTGKATFSIPLLLRGGEGAAVGAGVAGVLPTHISRETTSREQTLSPSRAPCWRILAGSQPARRVQGWRTAQHHPAECRISGSELRVDSLRTGTAAVRQTEARRCLG